MGYKTAEAKRMKQRYTLFNECAKHKCDIRMCESYTAITTEATPPNTFCYTACLSHQPDLRLN